MTTEIAHQATILVIDDEVDILDLLEMILEVEGYHVITAGDGSQGLQLAETHQPDLILLDLMMPGMDGYAVVEMLKAKPDLATIPVIMLTALAQVNERIQGLTAGAEDYITKPFESQELVLRIESVLNRTLPIKYINPLIGAMGEQFSADGVEQLASHLQAASAIQQGLLPQTPPHIPGVDMAGYLRSSMSVSGDFYDFIQLDDRRFGLVIADVRGKGIPGALLMVMIRTALRLVSREEERRFGDKASTANVLKRINDLIATDTDPDLFATVVYGVLDADANRLSTGTTPTYTFTYANAGHCYPFHLMNASPSRDWVEDNNSTDIEHAPAPRPESEAGLIEEIHQIRQLNVGGLVLGSFGFATFEEQVIELQPGDALLFYTDGILEAENQNGILYGEKRLAQVFESNYHLFAEGICQQIEADLLNFCRLEDKSDPPQLQDDLALIVVKVNAGRNPSMSIGHTSASSRQE